MCKALRTGPYTLEQLREISSTLKHRHEDLLEERYGPQKPDDVIDDL